MADRDDTDPRPHGAATARETAHPSSAVPAPPEAPDGGPPAGAGAASTQRARHPDPDHGLSAAEVAERQAQGLVNVTSEDNRRSFRDIVADNVLTRFNAILGTLLLIVLATGELRDALFGIVLVTNALVGIIQETRAKLTLDRLSVVTAPTVRAIRDGAPVTLTSEQIVRDDVLEVSAGDQLPVDGAVLTAANLEADESLVTGESDPVAKPAGTTLLSGSFVVAGHGRFAATAIGDHAYATRLATEAKRFASVHSELRAGTDTILRIGTWIIAPAAALLLISQLQVADTLSEGLRSTVAGVASIVPEGLVLLTSVAFAVSVVKLGRRRALLQELPAVEVLARVDTVCLDKTGTLTTGELALGGIESPAGGPADATALAALGALAAAEERPNATLRTVAAATSDPGWQPTSTMPFSSARKWSGAAFAEHGAWLLGAPEVLLPTEHPLHRRVQELAGGGSRVLALLRSDAPLGEEPPATAEPMALIHLEEQLRPEAPDTIRYFRDQGVTLKVISGDHPATVGAIARRVGIPDAGHAVDARDLPEEAEEVGDEVEAAAFGRVGPRHKRALVGALQRRGHTVAMTGDGVNDVLALKDADIGVAMGSGSDASRGVAQLVLLDDSFASLPEVTAEGRKVIANIERVAKLFVTKSVYAAILAVAVGIAFLPFPFFPRHLTLISSLTIGIPAFFLAIAPNTTRSRPGFLPRVSRFGIPAGVVAAAATFGAFAVAGQQPGVDIVAQRTSAVIVLFLVALWVLLLLARPLTEPKAALLGAMAVAFLLALGAPAGREFFDLTLPPLVVTLAIIGVAAIAIAVLELGWQLISWAQRRFFPAASS